MQRLRFLTAVVALLILAGLSRAADNAPTLMTAQGAVDKVEKDTLTVRPRGPDGKFEKALALKLTGTSKISTVTVQMRAGKPVLVQKETDAKDLAAKQGIAVIYTTGPSGTVLLAAVVQP
jgi:hypothetical protein